MILRKLAAVLQKAADQFPVVTLLGPRQSGKTTLVRALFPDHVYINLENPQTRAFHSSNGMLGRFRITACLTRCTPRFRGMTRRIGRPLACSPTLVS
jgi:hypothetical protein